MRSYAVIPAAGLSRRMGRPKLLLPWKGSTIIDHVLDAWAASQIDEMVAVVRSDDQPLADRCERHRVYVVRPSVDPPDMRVSVAWALQFIRARFAPDPADAWLLAPADMPSLSASVMDRLIAEHRTAPNDVLVPAFGSRRGHPVLLPWSTASEVDRLREGEGINTIVARHAPRHISCDDASILQDIDTPEDLDA